MANDKGFSAWFRPRQRIYKLKAELRKERARSMDLSRKLVACSEERASEWKRAERAEATRDQLRKSMERLCDDVAVGISVYLRDALQETAND